MFKLSIALLFGFICSIYGQIDSRAYLFSGNNFDENSDYMLLVKNDIEDLTSVELLNGVRSACVRGAWVMYAEKNYTGTAALFAGDEDCASESLARTGSMRYLGRPDAIHLETANVFDEEWFRGTGGVTQGDVIAWGPVKSFVLTGTRPWTFYTETFFNGDSICVNTENLGNDYYLGYDFDLTMIFPQGAQSFHPGCL